MITKAQLIPGTKFKFINSPNPLIKNKTFIIKDGYVTRVGFGIDQMCISKMGSKQMELYTFTMLGREIKHTIKYNEIEIVQE